MPSCVKASDLCQWIYEQTGNSWLASGSYYLLAKPAIVALIVLAALVCRYLLKRTIDRLVRSTSAGSVPAILKPLKQRLPTSLSDATTLFPERRRQRAEAIGSVLRSFTTAAVFSVAALMILTEIGVNVAPLIASAGIVGVALGFGAQSLVKDLIAGLFMLLEDQYGVGDVVDLGEASGTVEAVGLRITTVRDGRGVLWYIRNGEIVRVGNKSQGWAVVMVDAPIGFANVDQAAAVLREAADGLANDPEYADDIIDPPQVLGVEQITVDGAVLRTTVKTGSDAQWRVGRELRRRLTEALAGAGIAGQLSAGRVYIRPPAQASGEGADAGTGGPT
ncbi:MAG TPA: mechanosensitive ion channel family protein [Rugosimonospora sp.]|nr:mechanosensitive ion channel family protein [Rugosimonospora sp.]